MATIRWGTNSPGVIDATGSWVGGVVPTGSDTAVWDGEYTGPVTAGTGTETFGHVEVSQHYPAQMGTSGSPLLVNCGNMNLSGSGAGYWTTTADSIVVNTGQRSGDGIQITPTLSGTNETLAVYSGAVTVLGGTIAQLSVGGGVGVREPLVTINSGTTLSNYIAMSSGSVTSSVAPSSFVFVSGGVLTMQDVASPSPITVAGGTVRFLGTTQVTLNEMIVLGGTLDFSDNKGVYGLATAASLYVYPGGVANMNSGKSTGMDAGSKVSYLYRGGRLIQFRNDINPIMVP
jgi:hypothetical protein